jgi:hypothetical protein
MSGLGLFTAIDLVPGQEAQSMPDICIYVADTPDGTDFETHSWARDVFFGTFEGHHPRAACEGFGTLFNSLPDGVHTSKLRFDMKTHDPAGLHRAKDPAAGSVSQYYGISSEAVRDVAAGSEMTIDYGDWHYDKHVEYKAPSRSVGWLEQHGMCIDNIEIKTATNPSMGRGAFARRALQRGELVAPAPLQTFPDRSVFAKQIPEALFVNYCIQPAGTNLLLFPYGPGVNLINHDSKNPNVALRWSNHASHHHHWLSLPLEQLWEVVYPGGLLLEVVALRNIKRGEELYLDYGEDWEAAWNEHAATWKPVKGADDYVYGADMDRTQPFRTVEEQKTSPYPANLQTVCNTDNWDRDEYTTLKWKPPRFGWPEGVTYCNILKRTKVKRSEGLKSAATTQGETGEEEYVYEVSLNFHSMDPDREDKLKYIDTHVPHSEISFVDKPYQSDLHLPNAFRHPIGLPEHLVPETWRMTETV